MPLTLYIVSVIRKYYSNYITWWAETQPFTFPGLRVECNKHLAETGRPEDKKESRGHLAHSVIIKLVFVALEILLLTGQICIKVLYM